jgi:aryl-alcohol dehydrogenase-like predicted oxidoreductase
MYISETARRSTRCRIVAIQNQYDIVNGESSQYPGVRELAAAAGISFIAWSPLAQGLLTNRYLDISKIGAGDRLFDENNKLLPERTCLR